MILFLFLKNPKISDKKIKNFDFLQIFKVLDPVST